MDSEEFRIAEEWIIHHSEASLRRISAITELALRKVLPPQDAIERILEVYEAALDIIDRNAKENDQSERESS